MGKKKKKAAVAGEDGSAKNSRLLSPPPPPSAANRDFLSVVLRLSLSFLLPRVNAETDIL